MLLLVFLVIILFLSLYIGTCKKVEGESFGVQYSGSGETPVVSSDEPPDAGDVAAAVFAIFTAEPAYLGGATQNDLKKTLGGSVAASDSAKVDNTWTDSSGNDRFK